jgi:hypothetical protein
LYLRHLTRNYWFEHLAADSILYFQLNRSVATPQEPLRAFEERLLAAIAAHRPRKLVIDLRFNTGGSLRALLPLFEALAKLPQSKERGRLFVVTGHPTYSAGVFHVAYLKATANPVIVGEPIGDELDYWAEGGNVTLPNSRLILHYTDRFHAYSATEHPEILAQFPQLTKKDLFVVDMNVPDVNVDLPVSASAAHYFAGQDPVLDSIRAYDSAARR